MSDKNPLSALACEKVIRTLIVDDHRAVRAEIAALLREIDGVEVVGEASDGYEAVQLTSELSPDILFLDLDMPRMSGLEALALIKEAQPSVRVVILSMHKSEELVLRAMKLGAAGYMLKDAAPEELALAITAVIRGDVWLSSVLSITVISSYLERNRSGEAKSLETAR